MKQIIELAKQIVDREGGYVNDPDDPGGATNHGVTIGTMRRLGLDLDQDGKVTTADVQALTKAQATEIFVDNYFFAPRISKLPPDLHPTVFDMYVNAGNNAVKLLQTLLAQFGQITAVDGVIGPKTTAASTRALKTAPDHLVDAYGIARRNYYYRLADRRTASRKFARRRDGGKGGWIKRAETFISPRYHYSLEDHLKRVASWG